MSDQFNYEKRPGILYDEMFETLATGEVRRIIAVQDVTKGTLKYYWSGAEYAPTGLVGDVPYAVVTGVESLSVDDTTPGTLTPPAFSVSATVYIHDKTALFTLDGTTPVEGSIGYTLDNGSIIQLASPDEMAGFTVLCDAAGPMTLYVSYSNLTPGGMV